jgi:hypothetical protein
LNIVCNDVIDIDDFSHRSDGKGDNDELRRQDREISGHDIRFKMFLLIQLSSMSPLIFIIFYAGFL